MAKDRVSSQVRALQPGAHCLHSTLLHIHHFPCTTTHYIISPKAAHCSCSKGTAGSAVHQARHHLLASGTCTGQQPSRLHKPVTANLQTGLPCHQSVLFRTQQDDSSLRSTMRVINVLSCEPVQSCCTKGGTDLRSAQPCCPVMACCSAKALPPASNQMQLLSGGQVHLEVSHHNAKQCEHMIQPSIST